MPLSVTDGDHSWWPLNDTAQSIYIQVASEALSVPVHCIYSADKCSI